MGAAGAADEIIVHYTSYYGVTCYLVLDLSNYTTSGFHDQFMSSEARKTPLPAEDPLPATDGLI